LEVKEENLFYFLGMKTGFTCCPTISLALKIKEGRIKRKNANQSLPSGKIRIQFTFRQANVETCSSLVTENLFLRSRHYKISLLKKKRGRKKRKEGRWAKLRRREGKKEGFRKSTKPTFLMQRFIDLCM
jgi:hypothetical protein